MQRSSLRAPKSHSSSRSQAIDILVTAAGVPKLLDFGIAKLLDDRQAARHTLAVTQADIRIMTPDHASPEQVRGQPITTSSDVYVLGVLLYKMLCGSSPFFISSMRLSEIERAICEKDPPPPSDMVSLDGSAESDAVAADRNITPHRLRRILLGDLDNIVLMAMRKEPERRYASAQQMSSDIQRHLDGKPVIAHRNTLSYRSTKFVRRHWLPVAASFSAALLVLAFATTTYLQSLRIAAERDRAAQQRERAEHERARAEEYRVFSSIYSSCRTLEKTEATRSRPGSFWTRAQSACNPACKISRPPKPRFCRPSERSTTVSANIRMRCRCWTNPCSCRTGRTTSRISIRFWNSVAHTWARAI